LEVLLTVHLAYELRGAAIKVNSSDPGYRPLTLKETQTIAEWPPTLSALCCKIGPKAWDNSDVVDRHHPYVRWDHTSFFHDPGGATQAEADLPLKHNALWHRSRHSRIHRTDVLIRCEVLDSAVAALLAEIGGVQTPPTPPSLKYVDTLHRFGTLADVHKWRCGVLCEYCFFGGPTKANWKTPTLPTLPWE
jgi:hypothetical protein